ncbi:MAG: DUF2846 domain-containing protein [Pyrinomonadaceae bacterium]
MLTLKSGGPISRYLLWLVLLAGCASTPQATGERDTEAKQFSRDPGSSTLYVYRPDFDSPDSDTVLWIDGRLIGATLPKTYFRVHLKPGKHTLTGMGYDHGRLTIETRPGEVYFVSMHVVSGHTSYWQIPSEIGKQAVNRCCALMENWAPGQRPLLR